MKAANTGI